MPAEFPSSVSDSAPGRATKRSTAVYVIASLCMLTTVMQIAAYVSIFNQMQSFDGSSKAHLFAETYGAALGVLLIHFGAGVAVFLMRREALALMGCLLCWWLESMISNPFSIAVTCGLLFRVGLLYFTFGLVRKGLLH